MASAKPRALIAVAYEEAAQAYLRSLPPEHFMEATAQATQRKITLESLDLLHARRPDVQVFNELLVQYPQPRQRRSGALDPERPRHDRRGARRRAEIERSVRQTP